MTLAKHSQQTQKQFDAIIAGNYVNREKANWTFGTPPRPTITSTEHFNVGGHHKVRFFYGDGSVQVFDGGSWQVTKPAAVVAQ